MRHHQKLREAATKIFQAKGVKIISVIILTLARLNTAPLTQAETTNSANSDQMTLGTANGRVNAAAEVGYRQFVAKDEKQMVTAPYESLKSSPFFNIDGFYGTPKAGLIDLHSQFKNSDDWSLASEYNKGATFSARARWQEFSHSLGHRELRFRSQSPGQGDTVMVTPDERNTKEEYHSNFHEKFARIKVRPFDYPAHATATVREYTRTGPSQMVFYDMNCQGSGCHIVSKERNLDQRTSEWNLGVDGHFGYVDMSYTFGAMTFADKAPDPVDAYGLVSSNPLHQTPGNYTHAVWPDFKVFSDTLRINTSLADRVVSALTFMRGQSKNEDSDITKERRRLGVDLSYKSRKNMNLNLAYRNEKVDTADISQSARDLRQLVGHPVEPGRTTNKLETALRYDATRRFAATVKGSHSILQREETDVTHLPSKTHDTQVEIRGDYRHHGSLRLGTALGMTHRAGVPFAADFTDIYQMTLDSTWTPAPIWTFQAFYRANVGVNTDSERLKSTYYQSSNNELAGIDDMKNKSIFHNVNLTTIATPSKNVSVAATYAFHSNEIERDQIIGTPSSARLGTYYESETQWTQRKHVANLTTTFKTTPKLAITATGLLVKGQERWDPRLITGAGYSVDLSSEQGLSNISYREFIKLMGSLKGEYSFSKTLSLIIECTHVTYDDKVHDDQDGDATSLATMIKSSWQ